VPIARAIEQTTRRPAECVSERAPGIQEASRVFDGPGPAGFINAGRTLALQPRPCAEIGFRHTPHCNALALLNLNLTRFGHRLAAKGRGRLRRIGRNHALLRALPQAFINGPFVRPQLAKQIRVRFRANRDD
jgi:hypothetical protein